MAIFFFVHAWSGTLAAGMLIVRNVSRPGEENCSFFVSYEESKWTVLLPSKLGAAGHDGSRASECRLSENRETKKRVWCVVMDILFLQSQSLAPRQGWLVEWWPKTSYACQKHATSVIIPSSSKPTTGWCVCVLQNFPATTKIFVTYASHISHSDWPKQLFEIQVTRK